MALNQDLDKIGQLHDDILLRIVSLLDFKNAAQTSILAKRWRYLWTWLTNLDLDSLNLSSENFGWYIDDEIGPQRYLNWVDNVIDTHRSPCITKFRVFHDSSWTKEVSQVKKWVRFALSKRVQELDLRLRSSGCSPTFSLGIDILNHSLLNGITNLRSLRMSSVDISGEFLQTILFHCHLLEQLHVDNSDTLHTLNIVSDRLKHLTLVGCRNLKELQIDALNLFSFHFEDDYLCVRTHMVFKSVPTLVELSLTGESCLHPCPILEQISCVSNQLTKLSFGPTFDFGKFRDYVGAPVNLGIDLLFPNVKQLTLAVMACSLLFIEPFMNGCPMLHELKIESDWTSTEEARQLQNIELNEERNEEMPREQGSYCESQIGNLENWKARFKDFPLRSHPNLKVLELVGFRGCYGAVICSMSVIACANSFETLICDPRSASDIGKPWEYEIIEDIYTITKRVRKLAKLLPSNIRVGVRGESGLVWV